MSLKCPSDREVCRGEILRRSSLAACWCIDMHVISVETAGTGCRRVGGSKK